MEGKYPEVRKDDGRLPLLKYWQHCVGVVFHKVTLLNQNNNNWHSSSHQ